MKIITRTLLGMSLPALLLASGTSYAASLQSVNAVEASGKSTLRLQFDSKVAIPQSFVMQQPASIVLDFPGSVRGMDQRSKQLNSKFVKSVRVAGAADKLRVMVALNKITKYTTSIQGNAVVLTFDDNQNNSVAQQQRAQQQRAPQQAKRVTNNGSMLGNIDFRRTENGGGRAIIKLPNPSTVVETRKVGNSVVLTLKNVKTREPKKRIDVIDFATPASYIDVLSSGRDVEIKLSANSAFVHNTSRNGNDYIVNLQKVLPKKIINPLDNKKEIVYKGEKLSLNFQDIEVRSVLQLLADFTDKNIVVSDSVAGNITLRLKDVPWDQALAIVLEAKGLGMRENGTVIWVALATELEAKEQRELEAYKRKQELEPLITEYITVNYAKASNMITLINVNANTNTNTNSNTLTDNAYISVDERTNTIIVRDTSSRIAEIRSLIESLDVKVRQVSVESRIVIATDDFNKELGAKFGVSAFGKNLTTAGELGATDSMVNDLAGGGDVGVPSVDDRLNVNLPVIAPAGSLAFSLLSGDYLLDLELSALQAESKGEVISTPRVVTADKQKALIEQGVEIPYQESSSSGATSVSFKKAVLSLEVTPQVTPDDNVIMDLKVNSDSVGTVFNGVPSINTREVNTQVLVGNGQTIVLGGVHEESTLSNVSKVPVLGDLPILGRLFRTDVDSDIKSELLIFVTPKIMK